MKRVIERIEFAFATRDDCLDHLVPSDLRLLVGQRDRAEAKVKQLQKLCDESYEYLRNTTVECGCDDCAICRLVDRLRAQTTERQEGE